LEDEQDLDFKDFTENGGTCSSKLIFKNPV
jgi:hypothetical protein